MTADDRCSWCGEAVGPDDGYRAGEEPGARSAVFCRLEHIVPWVIRGAHWDVSESSLEADVGECSHCGEHLGDVRVLLIRHRDEHRIPDGFCSAEHLRAWAAAGGRWR